MTVRMLPVITARTNTLTVSQQTIQIMTQHGMTVTTRRNILIDLSDNYNLVDSS